MIRKYIYFSLFFLALSLSVKNVSAFTCGVDTVSRDELTYGTVAGADGNCWLDRNLGATRKATAYNDTQAYGWLFQWGRGADGHQIRTSATTNVRSYLIVPSHGFFIVVSNLLYNWTTSSGALWNGVNGIGNPCPIGWRIPTQSELSVMAVREGITNVSSAYASSLKMTAAGTRGLSDGALGVVGTYGVYWSSDFRKGFLFNSSAVNRNYEDYLATGLSVRCIKDTSVTSPNLTTQSVTDITPIQAMLTASLIATGGDDPVRSIQLTTISNNYSAPSECTAGTGSTGTYSCTLSNLTPNTTE